MTLDGLWLPPWVALARRDDALDLDLSPFVSAGQELGLEASTGYSRTLDLWAQAQLQHGANPSVVPLRALQAMGTHPVVYLAERTLTGLIRRPNLYYVSHPEKRIVKETEEWLWPLLPGVLTAAARAFAYGSVPVIFDWGTRDLRIEVPRYEGGVRSRTLKAHVHYVSAHEVWPGDAKVLVEDDELVAVKVAGRVYAADRAHVFRWDAEFGSWVGQGARRRAWLDYQKSLSVSVLQSRYLERSVDSPRVGWAPPGVTYSTGPNGVDESGRGDDIVLSADCLRRPLPLLVLWAPRWLTALAVGVLLGTATYSQERGLNWVRELVAVAVPPIPVFVVGTWTISWLEVRPWLGSLAFVSGWSQPRLTLAFGLAILSYGMRQALAERQHEVTTGSLPQA